MKAGAALPRVAMVGVGGVGGYFGGRMAQAGHCHLHFIGRGATLTALRERGLRVDSINGDFRLESSAFGISDMDATLPPMDLVVVTVKGAETFKSLIPSLKRLVTDRTSVLTLQNGVEAPYILMDALGKDKVLGGYCKIMSRIITPGHIAHEATDPTIGFGEMVVVENTSSSQERSPRVKKIADLLEKSGIKVEVPADIRVGLWHKLMLISCVSGIGACTRAPLTANLQVPETKAMAVLYEVVHVAQAQGIGLTEQDADQVMQYFIEFTPKSKGTTTSMQRDIINGIPSELDWLTGAVVRTGKKLGVPTPINDFILATLLPQEKKARKEIDYTLPGN